MNVGKTRMSYRIYDFGYLPELPKVRSYFGLTLDSNWLNAVQIVVSPDDIVLALVHAEKMAIFTSPSNKLLLQNTTTYQLQWLGTLANPNEIITSVLCLPDHIIVVGLDTGAVHFYDKTGLKLYSQRFILEPVISIKCYLFANENFVLYILYDTSLILIKSTDFLKKIIEISKSDKNQYLEKNLIDYYYHYEFASSRNLVDAPKTKSIYNDIIDIVVVPHQVSPLIDLIMEKSIDKNLEDITTNCQQYNLVISVGSKHFLGFHKLKETKRKILQSEEDSRIKLQVNTFSQIYDERREGRKVYLSPHNRWAAIVDNLERVILVDVTKKIIVRMWKGYPDAQCGFICVVENCAISTATSSSFSSEQKTDTGRSSIFLEIYVPSLGWLEIWSLLYGKKVARFNFCKNGQLIYKTPKPIETEAKTKKQDMQRNCLLLNPNDNIIKVIEIPFYYALDSINEEISADMQNLQYLKSYIEKYLMNNDIDELSQIENVTKEFQTTVGREQCLILLLNEERPRHAVYTTIVNTLYEKVKHDLSELCESLEQNDYQNVFLKKQENLQHEITVYKKYKHLDDFIIDLHIMTTSRQNERTLVNIELEIADRRVLSQWINDLEVINRLQENKQDENICSNDKDNALILLNQNDLKKVNQQFIDLVLKFFIKFNFKLLERESCIQPMKDLFDMLFQRHCQMETGLQIFREALNEMKEFNFSNMIKFVITFWLHEEKNYKNLDEVVKDMRILSSQLRLIYKIMEPSKDIYKNYNDIVAFWQDIREMFLNYTEPITLLIVVACKMLATKIIRSQIKKDILQQKTFKQNDTIEVDEDDILTLDDNWESISQEEAQWIMLIGKLESTLILSAVLRNTSVMHSTSEMPSFPLPSVLNNCSLKTIITGGKGIITDLVAQWLICMRIHPNELSVLNHENEQANPEENNKEKHYVIPLVLLLKRYFPYSVENSMLLCLMAWHYMFYWSQHLVQLEYFEAAMICLKQLSLQDFLLKQKVCCLLWKATVRIPFQLVSKLIHKIGHLPTEKLCQQELGMSAVAITRFLELSLEYLLELNQAVMNCGEIDKKEYLVRYEDILIEGLEPIQSLITKQHPVIINLLELQTELCYVLHFITFFQLKYMKALTKLFDTARYKAFFIDINTDQCNNPYNLQSSYRLPQVHADLQSVRLNFLRKSMTASIDLLRTNVDGTIFSKEYLKYTKRVLSLTNLWILDQQSILRQQVIDLYTHDYDSVAECILLKCEGASNISPKLLEIAGLRLNLYVSENSYRFRLMAKGPKLLKHQDYLANRPENDQNIQITATESADINIERLKNLVINAMRFMEFTDPKDKHLVGVANEMIQVCMEFIELDKLKTTKPSNIAIT